MHDDPTMAPLWIVNRLLINIKENFFSANGWVGVL